MTKNTNEKLIMTATILGLFAAMAALTPLLNTDEAWAATPCPTSMSFVVGGTGNGDGQIVTHGVPDGPQTNIVYAGSIGPVAGNSGGSESMREASAKLDAQARAFRIACPDAKITAVGHSLGAAAADDVCSSWQTDALMNTNTNCILTGNPKRPIENGRGGIMAQWPSFIPGFDFTGEGSAPGPIDIVNTCGVNDGICNAPNPVAAPAETLRAAVGYLTGAHVYSRAPIVDGLVDNISLATFIPEQPTAPGVPNTHDAFEPVAQQLVPEAPIRIGGPYVPTRVGDMLPPVLDNVLPSQIVDHVPPPVFPPLPF